MLAQPSSKNPLETLQGAGNDAEHRKSADPRGPDTILQSPAAKDHKHEEPLVRDDRKPVLGINQVVVESGAVLQEDDQGLDAATSLNDLDQKLEKKSKLHQ